MEEYFSWIIFLSQDESLESKTETDILVNGCGAETENKQSDELCSKRENHIDEVKTIEKDKTVIEVVGMELNERCENGEPWTKHMPVSKASTNHSVPSMESTPQEIILQTNVPANSRILITDAHTESVANEPSVILESKVTLNVIAPDRVSNIRMK